MKKSIHLCIMACMMFLLGSGCSPIKETVPLSEYKVMTLQDGTQVNESFNTEVMTTIDGTSFLLNTAKNWFAQTNMGFGIMHTPQLQKGFDEGVMSGIVDAPYSISLFYMPSATIKTDTSTQNETKLFYCFGVCRLVENDTQSEQAFATFTKEYKNLEKIADVFDSTYYFGYNDDYEHLTLTMEETKQIQSIIQEHNMFQNKIFLFPASTVPQTHFLGSFKALNTVDLEGNTFTSEQFENYDLTMIEVWSTASNPSIAGMPELEEFRATLPSNVNLISICIDGVENQTLAKEIMEYCGANYTVLLPNTQLEQNALQYISSVPMLFFLDSHGDIIGEPLAGVPGKEGEIAEILKQELRRRFELIR